MFSSSRIAAWAIVLFASGLTACGTRPFLLTTGAADATREGVDPVVVAPWEDGMRTDGGKGTVEWWYFDAHLDDGTTVVVNFMTKPIMRRGEPLMPKLEVTVTEPDGTTHKSFRIHEPSEFSAATERCDVRIGVSHVAGDLSRYVLHVEADEIVVDLEIERRVDSWRPGAGKVYFDDDRTQYLGWVVAVPHGAARGTVQVGERRWEVAGTAYHDHNWTNTAINRPIDHWYWGRGRIGSYTILFFAAEGSRRWGRAPLELFMLARDEEILIRNPDEFALEVRAQTNARPVYPRELRIEARQGEVRAHLRVVEPRVLEKEDLLATLPGVVRAPLKLFMHPWYLRFAADGEVEVDGQPQAGDVIYELMLF